MKKTTAIAESFVIGILLVGVPVVHAQSAKFTMGSGTGSAGGEVHVPIYLTVPRDPQYERIVAIVELPSILTYNRVEVTQNARSREVEVEVKDLAALAGATKKRIEITLKAGKEKPLQIGTMGSLILLVDPKAKPQMLSLPVIEVKGYTKGNGAEVNLGGDAGGVTIYEAGTEPQPSVNCFFFTH